MMQPIPTQEEQDQALLVQIEIAEALHRMRAEGIDPRIVIAGTAAAIGHAIAEMYGADRVAPWFANQANMIDGLMG